MVKFSTAEAREKLGMIIQEAAVEKYKKPRQKLSMIIQKAAVEKERIVLTRRGKELAALVPMEDMRFLEELEDRLDLEEVRAAYPLRKEARNSKTCRTSPIPWEKDACIRPTWDVCEWLGYH